MRKEPPSKANSFGVCTIGIRAEPVSNTPKNLKEIWSSDISIGCSFTLRDALIYASSWNMRNNLGLWPGCSIELNTLNEEKSISCLSDPAHGWANAPIVIHDGCLSSDRVPVCQRRQSGLLDGDFRITHLRLSLDRKAPMEQFWTRRKIQDPPDGWCRSRAALRSWDHKHQS